VQCVDWLWSLNIMEDSVPHMTKVALMVCLW
jgi:hypothetical protein